MCRAKKQLGLTDIFREFCNRWLHTERKQWTAAEHRPAQFKQIVQPGESNEIGGKTESSIDDASCRTQDPAPFSYCLFNAITRRIKEEEDAR